MSLKEVYLSVREAGEATGMGERYIRRMVNERRIRFRRVGGNSIRITERDLAEFMDAEVVEPQRYQG